MVPETDRRLATNGCITHDMEDSRVATDFHLFDSSADDNGTVYIIHLIGRK